MTSVSSEKAQDYQTGRKGSFRGVFRSSSRGAADEQEPHTKLVKRASTIQPRQSSIIQLDSVPADPSVLPPSVPLTRCASADFYGTTDSLALPELPLNVGRASPISRGGSVSPSYANKALSRRSSLITLSATAGLDGTEAQVPYVELPDRTHDPIIPALAEPGPAGYRTEQRRASVERRTSAENSNGSTASDWAKKRRSSINTAIKYTGVSYTSESPAVVSLPPLGGSQAQQGATTARTSVSSTTKRGSIEADTMFDGHGSDGVAWERPRANSIHRASTTQAREEERAREQRQRTKIGNTPHMVTTRVQTDEWTDPAEVHPVLMAAGEMYDASEVHPSLALYASKWTQTIDVRTTNPTDVDPMIQWPPERAGAGAPMVMMAPYGLVQQSDGSMQVVMLGGHGGGGGVDDVDGGYVDVDSDSDARGHIANALTVPQPIEKLKRRKTWQEKDNQKRHKSLKKKKSKKKSDKTKKKGTKTKKVKGKPRYMDFRKKESAERSEKKEYEKVKKATDARIKKALGK